MIDAHAEVTLPVKPRVAFDVVIDLDAADWLPAVRRVHRVSGASGAVGARYDVEVGLVGRHLRGVLVCRELEAPNRAVWVLEDGLDLSITATISPVKGGCHLELAARYSVGGGPFSGAVEKASAGAARREVARAVEQLAARFGRKQP